MKEAKTAGISRCPVVVSYSTVKGAQAVMLDLQGNQLSTTRGELIDPKANH